MTNWTDFVKKVAKEKSISYKEALKVASPLFEKEKKKGSKKKEESPKEEPKKAKPKKDKSKPVVKKFAKDKPKRDKNIMKKEGGNNYGE